MPARRIIGQYGKKKRTAGHAYLQHDVKVSNASAKNLKRGRGATKSKPIIGSPGHTRKALSPKQKCGHYGRGTGPCQRMAGHKGDHAYHG